VHPSSGTNAASHVKLRILVACMMWVRAVSTKSNSGRSTQIRASTLDLGVSPYFCWPSSLYLLQQKLPNQNPHKYGNKYLQMRPVSLSASVPLPSPIWWRGGCYDAAWHWWTSLPQWSAIQGATTRRDGGGGGGGSRVATEHKPIWHMRCKRRKRSPQRS
jgi:hypothetical protein